jgi:hypothetical protein
MIELAIGRIVGHNQYLIQKPLVVHMILNAVRPTPLNGINQDLVVPFEQAAVLWIAGHIIPRGIFSQDMMITLLQMRSAAFLQTGREYNNILEIDPEAALPTRFLTIADRQWLSMTGVPAPFSLQRGDVDHELPEVFEGISYNLARPVEKEWRRVHKENTDGSDTTDAPDPFGPPNPSHSPFNRGQRPTGTRLAQLGSPDSPHGGGGNDGGRASDARFQQTDGSERAGDH